jgi:hypothetical protein
MKPKRRDRPPAFPVELLQRPVPAAMQRWQDGVRAIRKRVDSIKRDSEDADVNFVEFEIGLRARLASVRRTLHGGDIQTARADLANIIGQLDEWLKSHRGE